MVSALRIARHKIIRNPPKDVAANTADSPRITPAPTTLRRQG